MSHLANELIVAIGENVPSVHDLNALAQTNRRFSHCIDSLLYSRKTTEEFIELDWAQRPSQAIVWAIEHGREDTLRKALRYNTDGLDQVLWLAVRRRFDRHLPILLSAYSIDRHGTVMMQQAMSYASSNGRTEVLRTLLESGLIDPWGDELLPRILGHSARGNSAATTRYLLGLGTFDLDYRDDGGEAVLGIAVGHGFAEVAQLLLDTGRVDVEIVSQATSGCTPLLHAVSRGREAIARALLDTGRVDVNRAAEPLSGQTALMLAAGQGHAALVQMLLAQDGIEVDARDNDRRSALMLAAAGGHELVVEMLLAAGEVNVDAWDRYGRTALSQARSNGQFAIYTMMMHSRRGMTDGEA